MTIGVTAIQGGASPGAADNRLAIPTAAQPEAKVEKTSVPGTEPARIPMASMQLTSLLSSLMTSRPESDANTTSSSVPQTQIAPPSENVINQFYRQF